MENSSSQRYLSKHGLITPKSSERKEQKFWKVYVAKKEDTPTRTDQCCIRTETDRRSQKQPCRHISGLLTPPFTPVDLQSDSFKPVLRDLPAQHILARTTDCASHTTPSPLGIPNLRTEGCKESSSDDETSSAEFLTKYDGANEQNVDQYFEGKQDPTLASSNSSEASPFSESSTEPARETKIRNLPNLRSPCAKIFPEPTYADVETPTPLAEASRALNDFPFPRLAQESPCLAPLAPRCTSSPLRSSQWAFRGGHCSRPGTPGQRFDRFIPPRQSIPDLRSPFLLTKPADRLFGDEKVFRRNNRGPDPFASEPRRSSRFNDRLRQLRTNYVASSESSRNTHPTTTSGGRGTLVSRHFSPGAVWSIGGPAALGEGAYGVPDGRGGMLNSGTNAPLYFSRFFARSDSEGEAETHEQRLALAANIDLSGRTVLHSPGQTQTNPSRAPRMLLENQETIWMDGEWIKKGSTTRLLLGE